MRDHEAVQGNSLVVAGLEKAVERAKGGTVRAVAIIFCEHQGVDIVLTGDEKAHAPISLGADLLKHVIINSVINVQHLGTTQPPANLARYDFATDPICFDFVPWLVTAEMVRRRANIPPPLRVGFTRSAAALREETAYKRQFIERVIKPSLALFGAIEDMSAGTLGRRTDYVGLRDIARACREGEEVPRIRVPPTSLAEAARKLGGRPPVTLTLRETESAHVNRNSSIEDWMMLAHWLRERGEHVIVVRDTAAAREPFADFETWPEASEDLHTRAALYESARLNMFSLNGPWGLAYFGSRPWLTFAVVDDDQEDCNTPAWWQAFMGLNADKQLPWAGPAQRIVYARDSFEEMRAAFEAVEPLLGRRAAAA
jgi:hypothetical protein